MLQERPHRWQARSVHWLALAALALRGGLARRCWLGSALLLALHARRGANIELAETTIADQPIEADRNLRVTRVPTRADVLIAFPDSSIGAIRIAQCDQGIIGLRVARHPTTM